MIEMSSQTKRKLLESFLIDELCTSSLIRSLPFKHNKPPFKEHPRDAMARGPNLEKKGLMGLARGTDSRQKGVEGTFVVQHALERLKSVGSRVSSDSRFYRDTNIISQASWCVPRVRQRPHEKRSGR